MKHQLPKLPYAYDALEPFIDERTMEIHHAKHHATYVAKLNEALDKYPKLFELSLQDLLSDLDKVPEDIRMAVKNHGGGHYNHSMFWKLMCPQTGEGGSEPQGKLAEEIQKHFNHFAKFKEEFTKSATGLFGSGWTWLVRDGGKLAIITMTNQDNPLSVGKVPVLGLDLWEHAYYLKYQNRRAEYIESWWSIVNWEEINRSF